MDRLRQPLSHNGQGPPCQRDRPYEGQSDACPAVQAGERQRVEPLPPLQ